ncbi:ABC transporter permease [Nocardioides lianchengensis]|uniref:Peptide/nickel transport system permease protein n=1 Tax=Nocardioides lianchengensis TaxID=1045774 RepID=A0A1G6SDA2_9ACTN|nr:ABC transporter permease [Nocardioides lianchengensis]NYG09797.1 peptide/nickel transport system permease protein [Nocardioides lianchengensis]SDD14713.1 peptide/nickel transport system permease protein [Nocardioides lianchengensis]
MASASSVAPATPRVGAGVHPWVRFGVRRLGRLLVSLWVLVTASFLMIHLIPGDPVRGALGPTAPASLVAAKREAMGLDDPILVQYWHYLQGLFTGDLGTSLISQLPVSQIVSQRLPATLQLALLAFLVAVAVAVPVGVSLGVLTRAGHGRRTELVFTTGSVVLGTVPDFLLGVGLVYVFGVQLDWLPVAGNDSASAYVLPVLALAIGPAAILARIVRVEMVAVLEADFVRTARAKRLPRRTIYLGHALPNALTASLTLGGLFLSSMVAGTVLVENVFAWPGLGSTIVSSILTKDYQVVQAVVLVYGVGVLLVNTLVDVALALLDPRSTIRED